MKQQSSGEVNNYLALEYIGEPTPLNKKEYIGIKVVVDKGENFYSIASGMYRYKTGRVLNKSGYDKLYKNNNSEYYRAFMEGKTAVFIKPSHAYRCFPELMDNPDYAFVKVTLTGNLQQVLMKRKGIDGIFNVILGDEIKSIERL